MKEEISEGALKRRMDKRLAELGLDRPRLAELTGDKERNVFRWMNTNDDVTVPAGFVQRFIDAVPVNPDWLLTGRGGPAPGEYPVDARPAFKETLAKLRAYGDAARERGEDTLQLLNAIAYLVDALGRQLTQPSNGDAEHVRTILDQAPVTKDLTVRDSPPAATDKAIDRPSKEA